MVIKHFMQRRMRKLREDGAKDFGKLGLNNMAESKHPITWAGKRIVSRDGKPLKMTPRLKKFLEGAEEARKVGGGYELEQFQGARFELPNGTKVKVENMGELFGPVLNVNGKKITLRRGQDAEYVFGRLPGDPAKRKPTKMVLLSGESGKLRTIKSEKVRGEFQTISRGELVINVQKDGRVFAIHTGRNPVVREKYDMREKYKEGEKKKKGMRDEKS